LPELRHLQRLNSNSELADCRLQVTVALHIRRILFETEARSRASSSCDKGCKETEASKVLLPV
jgi:hypothetical protein